MYSKLDRLPFCAGRARGAAPSSLAVLCVAAAGLVSVLGGCSANDSADTPATMPSDSSTVSSDATEVFTSTAPSGSRSTADVPTGVSTSSNTGPSGMMAPSGTTSVPVATATSTGTIGASTAVSTTTATSTSTATATDASTSSTVSSTTSGPATSTATDSGVPTTSDPGTTQSSTTFESDTETTSAPTAEPVATTTVEPPTSGPIEQPTDPCAPRAGYRSLLTELLGKSAAEIDAKIAAGYQQLFHGSSDKTVYYEFGPDEAYVLDVNNNDVRSEGISYGMMISVQLDKKAEFDKLWKFAKQHMYQSSGAIAGYFAWQVSTSGQVIGNYSAPDGEEYMATALILASKRWGDGSGIFAYSSEARSLLTALATKGDFNRSNYSVTFGPTGNSATYTDPSYVLPAFYEMWACFDTANQSFWKNAVSAGRQLLQKTTHSTTGLAPYLANFDGTPYSEGPTFNTDSWRVVGNIMMDHHFYNADPWQTTFAERFAAFFKVQSQVVPVPAEFNLDGTVTQAYAEPAKGLVSQNALVAFGVPPAEGTSFVQALWATPIPEGQYRYYDGMLYMLALLHAGGRFHVE